MAYKDKETIATNSSVGLTATKLVDGVRCALVSARGGNFTYDVHAGTMTAGQGHPLQANGFVEIPEDWLQDFRIIRDTADTGTLYVTYFDRPLNMSQWRGVL